MRKSVLAAALLCVWPLAAQAEDYPFVGRWDCEVATFTFTNTTYNNGSETLRMTKVEKRGQNYILTFPRNYRIGLSGITATRMEWLSGESGDGFTCKKLR